MALPTVSDTMNPVAGSAPESGSAPFLWHEGQPWSQQTAAARLAELDKDSEYTKALLAGDMAKVAERAAFKQMSEGKQPGPVAAPVDSGSVLQQMSEREQEHHEKRLDAFDRLIVGGMSPLMREQYGRRLATQEQHDFAVRERERLMADPAFVARIHPRSGKPDPTAIEQWIHMTQIAAAPIAPPDHKWE
jgi:hypothetical protein